MMVADSGSGVGVGVGTAVGKMVAGKIGGRVPVVAGVRRGVETAVGLLLLISAVSSSGSRIFTSAKAIRVMSSGVIASQKYLVCHSFLGCLSFICDIQR